MKQTIRAALPDHCALWFPRDRLRRFASTRALSVDRSLQPLGAVARIARYVGALAWPLNSLARAALAVRKLGAQASVMSGRSLASLLIDCWRHALFHNLAPKAYFKYRVFLPRNTGRSYLQDHESSILLREVRKTVDPATIARIDDKMAFARFCKSAGLPAADVIASCEDGGSVEWRIDPATLADDLAMKLTDSASGYGFELARWCGDGWTVDGARFNVDDLSEHLRRKSAGHSAIVQRRLRNHADMLPLAGRALSTVRIVTATTPRSGVSVVGAAMRMGTGNSPVDNIAAGGLAAPVDTHAGRLGLATGKNISLGWFTKHPDSGARIEGFKLPHWPAAMELCLAAHRQLLGAPTIGWDVVITQDGPLLLEGNLGWDVELLQALGDTAAGDTAAADAMAHALFGKPHALLVGANARGSR